jgi:hypothetical protein
MSHPFRTAVVTGAGYAAEESSRGTFAAGLQPILTPEQVAKAVVELALDPAGGAEYLVSGTGLRPVG